MIKRNLELVRQNIAQSAVKSGVNPQDIILVCVTKQANAGQIKEAISCGITDAGENRVQDAVLKYDVLRNAAYLHLIGHLQTNKVKKAVEIFDLIHSVDSLHLAEAISKEASKISKIQNILIQVNISQEESKFGVSPKELMELIKQAAPLSNVRISGLMTIAPLADNPEKSRPYFKKLKHLSEDALVFLNSIDYACPGQILGQARGLSTMDLSMGMSGDYQVAIEEGATMVRIGSAIFNET